MGSSKTGCSFLVPSKCYESFVTEKALEKLIGVHASVFVEVYNA